MATKKIEEEIYNFCDQCRNRLSEGDRNKGYHNDHYIFLCNECFGKHKDKHIFVPFDHPDQVIDQEELQKRVVADKQFIKKKLAEIREAMLMRESFIVFGITDK